MKRANCPGTGRTTLSLKDVDRRWLRCSRCGKILNIRPTQRDCEGNPIDGWEASIPKHLEPSKEG
jgi:hypothetical protein